MAEGFHYSGRDLPEFMIPAMVDWRRFSWGCGRCGRRGRCVRQVRQRAVGQRGRGGGKPTWYTWLRERMGGAGAAFSSAAPLPGCSPPPALPSLFSPATCCVASSFAPPLPPPPPALCCCVLAPGPAASPLGPASLLSASSPLLPSRCLCASRARSLSWTVTTGWLDWSARMARAAVESAVAWPGTLAMCQDQGALGSRRHCTTACELRKQQQPSMRTQKPAHLQVLTPPLPPCCCLHYLPPHWRAQRCCWLPLAAPRARRPRPGAHHHHHHHHHLRPHCCPALCCQRCLPGLGLAWTLRRRRLLHARQHHARVEHCTRTHACCVRPAHSAPAQRSLRRSSFSVSSIVRSMQSRRSSRLKYLQARWDHLAAARFARTRLHAAC